MTPHSWAADKPSASCTPRFKMSFSGRGPLPALSLSAIPGMYSITRKSTPSCVSKFMQQPQAANKLKELQTIDSWKQREFVEAGGWATPVGDKTPNSGLANACAEQLLKAKSS